MEDSINKIEKRYYVIRIKKGIVNWKPMINSGMILLIKQSKNFKVILGDDVIDIQHIGSTAIPTIKAKPIIDIVLESMI